MSAPVHVFAHDRRIAEALLEISNTVGSVLEQDDILQRICEIGARVMGTDTCSVYLIDADDKDFVVLHASKGLSRAEELGVRGFKLGDGIPGWAAKQNQTTTVVNAMFDPRFAPLDDTKDEEKYVSYCCVPLRIQEEVVGVLSTRRQQPREWTEEEIVFAEIVAKQIGIVLEKARLYRDKVEAERLAAITISLSGVAHYIKNVLQNMMGGAYFVETGLKRADLDKARKGWELLERSIDKIKNLVENMLTYSKDWSCTLRPGDANALIADLARHVEPTAFEKGVKIALDLDDQLPELQIDKDALHDALLNLVTNAIDALADTPGGEVRISTKRDVTGKVARIRVVDNGPGIPPEVRERMFQLFFTTKGRAGTGIGLSVTRRIVDEHRGRMSFETEVGRGTTFTIELPMA